MGSGRFDSNSYSAYAATTKGLVTDEIYSSRKIANNLNPRDVRIRESRDSADNPQSTPVIIAIDVTGSMGIIADVLARKGLGTLFTEILKRKPITDPHLMFMAVGDAEYDRAPLQVSQFEADNRIVEQLTQIFLEHGGGGNSSESYNLPWYFAAKHTEHDSMIKRQKRGYLFTVGDEEAPAEVTRDQIRRLIGDTLQKEMSSVEMLRAAQRSYDVFHIIVEEGDYARQYMDKVVDSWQKLLGKERVILLADYKKLAETIVSAIEVAEGKAADKAAEGDDVVYAAVKGLSVGRKFDLTV